MVDIFVALLAVSIVKSTPLVLGALSGVVCERSGVVNIAIEGMMLAGAFAGFAVAAATGSLVAGLLGAVLAASALALLHAVMTMSYRVDQIVSGTAINILAVGLTGFLNRQLFPFGGPPGLTVLPRVPLPVLEDIPVLGPILFQHQPLTILAVILVIVLQWALFQTRWGLRTRATGEHPLAADTVGIDVWRLRIANVVLGGMLAGLAGAYLTMESVPHFEPLMTNGRGFIALAAMIFGKWTPLGSWGAALLFGLTEALPVTLQIQGVNVSFQLVAMLPYVLTIVVVAGAVGRASPPAAVGVPYTKGERVGG
jgi:general nucleoside transport system permease protein